MQVCFGKHTLFGTVRTADFLPTPVKTNDFASILQA